MKTEERELVLEIIRHLKENKDKNRILEDYNHSTELCIASVEFFKSEEDKIYLLEKSGCKGKIGAAIMPYIENEKRREVVIEKCHFDDDACDAYVKSFMIEDNLDSRDEFILKIRKVIGGVRQIDQAIGRHLKKTRESESV